GPCPPPIRASVLAHQKDSQSSSAAAARRAAEFAAIGPVAAAVGRRAGREALAPSACGCAAAARRVTDGAELSAGADAWSARRTLRAVRGAAAAAAGAGACVVAPGNWRS